MMRLATVRSAAGPRVALAVPGGWVDVAEAATALLDDDGCPSTLLGLLRRDGAALATARRIAAAFDGPQPGTVHVTAAARARLGPPVADAGAFLDFYAFDGARAAGARAARPRGAAGVVPLPGLLPLDQRAFLGHGDEVVFPAGEEGMDVELEVAGVLGGSCSCLKKLHRHSRE